MTGENRMNPRRPGECASSPNRPSLQLHLASILVLICAITASPAQSKNSTSGQQSFESICAPCHGLNGKGGERAPDIAGKTEIVRLTDTQLLKVLNDGRPQAGMPSYRMIGPAKLSAILDYLRLLQGKHNAPPVMAGLGNGKELFSGKGGCSQCHMIHGVGGFIGPDLSDYGANHSADDIRKAILNADSRLNFRKRLARATAKDGQKYSGLVRNEDNFSIQLQSVDGTFHLLERSSLAELTFDAVPLMPGDYNSKFSKSELDQLIAYLINVGNEKR
jgi:cytochrome c oxidase cbb3-type subunit 3